MHQISFPIARCFRNVLKFCAYFKRYMFSPFLLHMCTDVSYTSMLAYASVFGTIILSSIQSCMRKPFIHFPFNFPIFAHSGICILLFHLQLHNKNPLEEHGNTEVCNTDFLSQLLLLIHPFSHTV